MIQFFSSSHPMFKFFIFLFEHLSNNSNWMPKASKSNTFLTTTSSTPSWNDFGTFLFSKKSQFFVQFCSFEGIAYWEHKNIQSPTRGVPSNRATISSHGHNLHTGINFHDPTCTLVDVLTPCSIFSYSCLIVSSFQDPPSPHKSTNIEQLSAQK